MSGEMYFQQIPCPQWPLPMNALRVVSEQDATLESPRYLDLMRQYLTACVVHFRQRGWLERSYAAVPGDLGPGRQSAETTRRFSAMAHQVDADVRVLSRLFPQDMNPYGWNGFPHHAHTDAVDVWAPPAQFFDIPEMQRRRAGGAETWLTIDRPPYSGTTSIHADAASVRVLAWQAYRLKTNAIDAGCANHWPDAETHPAPQDCIEFDPTVLLYPGGPFGLGGPIPSVRLKQLRHSAQDAAYLRLLEEHGLEHVAVTLSRSLAPYAASGAYRTHYADGKPNGWPSDVRLFEAARHIMAQQLVEGAAGSSVADSGASRFGDALEWRQFMAKARRVRIFSDGVRVRFLGTADVPAAEVDCSLTILNQTRVPLHGHLRFADLPPDWTAGDNHHELLTIPPGGARFVTLTARSTVLATRSDGHLTLPVDLVTEAGDTYRVDVAASCVTAMQARAPVTIDGDLSDWPIGTTNSASGFTLITGASLAPEEASDGCPRHTTHAFVMRDRESLYVAINCETGWWHTPPANHRSGVEYDDQIPTGEDLVELLIDPLNAGSRLPSDLFHVVVKRSGIGASGTGYRVRSAGWRSPAMGGGPGRGDG